ncbi:MAG TPA: MFS transporter [Pseudonocardiaceae bacterium]
MTTARPAGPIPDMRERIGLATILAATFMGQVDGFVVNVASPSIQRDLPAGFDQIQLIGAIYVLACAAGLITGGRLGDRYGHRRVFLLGVAGFTLASLACGLAPNPELLIAARFVQGATAALLIPQELSILRTMYPDEERRARAVGAYGVVLGLGVICGLAGGGILVHLDVAGLGWRSAFLVNVPIGLAIVALGLRSLPESRSAAAPRLDLPGVALTAVALPALLLPLIAGPGRGWPAWIWLVAAFALVTSGVLVWQQRSVAAAGGDPLFPPRALTAPGIPISLATAFTFFAGNSGLFLVFTYYVQTGLGFDALAGGLMFVWLGVGFAVGSSVSGRLTRRFGTRPAVAGCGFLAAALLAQLAVVQAPAGAQPVLLAVVIGLIGLAEGLVVTPLVAGILSRVAPDDVGAVSGAASTVTQFGLASGYAAIGTLYGLVLGGTPGAPDAPADLAPHVTAYTATSVVLAALALVTGFLCLRRDLVARPVPAT